MKHIFIVFFFLSLFACSKKEYEVMLPKVPPVADLTATVIGDSALISWTLPAGYDSLNVIINDSLTERELPMNTTSTKVGIIETNKDYRILVKLADVKGNKSTGEIVRFRRDGAAPVRNLTAEQNDTGLLLKWAGPIMPVTKITIKVGTLTVELGPTVTSYQFNNMPTGDYIISVITINSNSQVSNTVYLPFHIGATMVAYLGTYSDSTSMITSGDDDIKAGAKWLFANYPTARYISFDDIKNNTVDLSQFRVIWWNYDVENTNVIPAIANDQVVVTRIGDYYKNGGNLLFNQFACRYFWTLGRMTTPYFMFIGNGAGFSNNDTWGVAVKIGKKQDRSAHPLYAGIPLTTTPDGRVFFPTIGPGWREDHNTVIENIPGFLGMGFTDDATYNRFQNDNQVEWIGHFEGLTDYWSAGIMEMKPKDQFKGSAIYIGIAAVEWNQNSGVNIYQSNVEMLYKNAISYLKTK